MERGVRCALEGCLRSSSYEKKGEEEKVKGMVLVGGGLASSIYSVVSRLLTLARSLCAVNASFLGRRKGGRKSE